MSKHDVIDGLTSIRAAIDTQKVRIASLEAKVGQGVDDMYLADKINYHLGVLSGLRQAILIFQLQEA